MLFFASKFNRRKRLKPVLSNTQPTKKYILSMFALSCVLLELFVFVIYQQSRDSHDSTDWVIHSYEVLRVGHHALIDSVDLANNGLNYIEGYSSDLKTYNELIKDLDKRFTDLNALAVDNGEQGEN